MSTVIRTPWTQSLKSLLVETGNPSAETANGFVVGFTLTGPPDSQRVGSLNASSINSTLPCTSEAKYNPSQSKMPGGTMRGNASRKLQMIACSSSVKGEPGAPPKAPSGMSSPPPNPPSGIELSPPRFKLTRNCVTARRIFVPAPREAPSWFGSASGKEIPPVSTDSLELLPSSSVEELLPSSSPELELLPSEPSLELLEEDSSTRMET